MVMSLWMYTVRHVATCAARTAASVARIDSMRGGACCIPLSRKSSLAFSSVVCMPFSSVLAGVAAPEPHRYRNVDSGAVVPGATETEAHSTLPTQAVLNSYTGQLLLHRSRGMVPSTYSGAYHCTGGCIVQQTLPQVGRHIRYIDGCHRTACGTRRFHSVITRYNSSSGVEVCGSSSGSSSISRCCTVGRSKSFSSAGRSKSFSSDGSSKSFSSDGSSKSFSSDGSSKSFSSDGSSKSFSSDGSSRAWNGKIMRTVGLEGSFRAASDEGTDSRCKSVLSLHAGPMMVSAARKGHSLPMCFSLTSRYNSSSSVFSLPPSSLPSPLSYLLVLDRRMHATRHGGARMAAGALPVSASAQPYISRAPDVEEDWNGGEQQIFLEASASVTSKGTASLPSREHEGSCEPSKWDFAQIRRIPSTNKRSTVASDGETAGREREEARETPERLTRNVPIAGAESSSKVVTKRSPLPVTSRSRRVHDSGRRAPPLLRVTDAAAARIREIVEAYNRQAARSRSREGVALRNGCREQENSSSESPHRNRSRAGSSAEVPAGAGNCRRAIGIRIGLKKRGCSGLSYTIDVATREEGEDKQSSLNPSGSASAAARVGGGRRLFAAAAADEIVETKGGTVVLAGDAIMFLVGTELDFVDTELERKFVFKNPNEKQACGCGKSFTV